ncbi:MAG: MinD/ParA family protein [Planctomycetota bacterium]
MADDRSANGATSSDRTDMAEQAEPNKSGKRATIFAVTSGKGGVGKTSLSVNIACEFSRRGHRTIIVDTDLGLANAHILAGIKPKRSLSDYIEGTAELAEIIEDGPCKVKFISGGSGVKDMANLDDNGRARICVAIEDLAPFCDVMILDTGAGVSKGVTDFVSMADQTILVTTSNFAAIADAYGIVKVVVQDGYDRPIHCVVNRVRSPEEAEQVFLKLKGCTERFLAFDLNWLGLLPEDSSVEGAVLKRSPFSEVFPGSVAARYLAKLVSGLERYVGKSKSAPQAAKG